MTVAVIAIALALPSGLFVLLKNLQIVAGGWDRSAQISLFLKTGTSSQRMHTLAGRLRQRGDIAEVETIAAEQALAEFRAASGFGEALEVLKTNPLPPVIVVIPALARQQPAQVAALVETLAALPEVDQARLDMQWLQRLYALMDMGRRATLAIAAMLGLAVLLVVGNTIRLDIQNRREEIEVTTLVGATNAFIRRPFLYRGFWYGLFGGVLAWLMVRAALMLLNGPAEQLAGLYGSGFELLGLGGAGSLLLLTLAAGLGLLGSWVAVSRHLGKIEPR